MSPDSSQESPLDHCVVLTPARNEADRLPGLAESLARQTLRPRRWLILENGSNDGTYEVAVQLAARHDFVRPMKLAMPAAAPDRGAPVVQALHVGIDALEPDDGLVLKLDADVTIDEHHIERLAAEFLQDARLGVASGSCLEEHGGRWRTQHMTGHMVWCAARAWRRDCLQDLVPFEERFGWDSIDVAMARVNGWRTRVLKDLTFRHHRIEGERDGRSAAAWINEGRGSHFLGYRPTYLLLRAAGNALRDPRALMMAWGYVSSALGNSPQYGDPRVLKLLRDQQRWRHVGSRVREAFGKRSGS